MIAADDGASLDRFRAYRAEGDRRLRNDLVLEYRWVALYCSKRFAVRGEPLDDLLQVAQLGVLKAVERFDPDRGVQFPAFAMPTVMGELRRHFRDKTWAVRVPRRPKEVHAAVASAAETLTQELCRQPTADEVAQRLQISREDVLEAMEAREAYRAVPLVPPSDEDVEQARTLGADDPNLEVSRLLLHSLLRQLPPADRTIVFLRFFEGLTQREIAERVGSNQVHVSRRLQVIFDRLRRQLDDTETVAETVAESLGGSGAAPATPAVPASCGHARMFDAAPGYVDPMANRNPEKDPDDWTTGDEPMTGPQESYIHTLAREAGEEVPAEMTKAEASKTIDHLQEQANRGT